jgi:outer membrane protein TolC
MRKLKYIIIVLLLPIAGLVSAQQALTLGECRKMALENNKQIAIANQDKERADLVTSAAKTNFLPNLSAGGSGIFDNSETQMNIELMGLGEIPLDLDLNQILMADISVEQPIFMGGKIISGYKMSRVGSDIANLNKALTEDEVLLETDKAYWICIQAEELRLSAQQYKETIEEFYRVIKKRL